MASTSQVLTAERLALPTCDQHLQIRIPAMSFFLIFFFNMQSVSILVNIVPIWTISKNKNIYRLRQKRWWRPFYVLINVFILKLWLFVLRLIILRIVDVLHEPHIHKHTYLPTYLLTYLHTLPYLPTYLPTWAWGPIQGFGDMGILPIYFKGYGVSANLF